MPAYAIILILCGILLVVAALTERQPGAVLAFGIGVVGIITGIRVIRLWRSEEKDR